MTDPVAQPLSAEEATALRSLFVGPINFRKLATLFTDAAAYPDVAEAVAATLDAARSVPENAARHGYTCGTCSWGRDREHTRDEYLAHQSTAAHPPEVPADAARSVPDTHEHTLTEGYGGTPYRVCRCDWVAQTRSAPDNAALRDAAQALATFLDDVRLTYVDDDEPTVITSDLESEMRLEELTDALSAALAAAPASPAGLDEQAEIARAVTDARTLGTGILINRAEGGLSALDPSKVLIIDRIEPITGHAALASPEEAPDGA